MDVQEELEALKATFSEEEVRWKKTAEAGDKLSGYHGSVEVCQDGQRILTLELDG